MLFEKLFLWLYKMLTLSINSNIIRCNVFCLTLKLSMHLNVKLRTPAIKCCEDSDYIDDGKKTTTSDWIFFPSVQWYLLFLSEKGQRIRWIRATCYYWIYRNKPNWKNSTIYTSTVIILYHTNASFLFLEYSNFLSLYFLRSNSIGFFASGEKINVLLYFYRSYIFFSRKYIRINHNEPSKHIRLVM